MGRKSLDRERKNNQEKTIEWIKQLDAYFQENGLRGITMDVIARELKKSKTTVYDYFKTKEELLNTLVSYKLEEIRGFEHILENDDLSFLERYYQTIEFLTQQIGGITNLFLSDLRELYPHLWQEIEFFLDENTLILRDFYLKGMEQGAFNKIDTFILVMSDQLFFRAITNPDFLSKSGLQLKEALQQYLRLKFFGLIKQPNGSTV